jgi:hypothetical protein
LLLVSALPLPDTPVLIFAGKVAKYGFYAWTVFTFPERFARYFDQTRNGGKPPNQVFFQSGVALQT